MKKYKDLILDEERVLYGIENTEVLYCKFDGMLNGEAALKEVRDIDMDECYFNLRYAKGLVF